jgi:hypothetical protein
MAVLAFIREILRLNNQLGSGAATASPFGGAFSALHRDFAALGAEVTVRYDHEFVIAHDWRRIWAMGPGISPACIGLPFSCL